MRQDPRVEDVLAAMERVVSAATPGKWRLRECSNGGAVLLRGEPGTRAELHTQIVPEHDAEFMSRFDPPTLTALLAVVKAAQAFKEKIVALEPAVGDAFAFKQNHGFPYLGDNWASERDALRDALDALTRPPQASATVTHGVTCPKVAHTRDGYLHGEDDDTPFLDDGLYYCGRCHTFLRSM